MSEDPKVLPFRPGQTIKLPTATPILPDVSRKLGIWPLGPADVVMSLDLLNIIIAVLESPSPPLEDRQRLATQLRANYKAPFTP